MDDNDPPPPPPGPPPPTVVERVKDAGRRIADAAGDAVDGMVAGIARRDLESLARGGDGVVRDTAAYVASIPERVVRSAAGVVGGVLKEGGDLLLPRPVKRSSFYEGFIGSMERWLIRDVGQVEGVIADPSPDLFVARKTVGNLVEAASLVVMHASPLLVVGVAADLVKGGQVALAALISDLKREGVVAEHAGESLDALLDGVHGVAAKLARQFDVPPLTRHEIAEVAGDLRARIVELAKLRPYEAKDVEALVGDLRETARDQRRGLWQIAGAVAQGVGVAAGTGARLADEHVITPYREQLARLRHEGFVAYWRSTSAPYYAALIKQWRGGEAPLTQRLLSAASRWVAGEKD
ncbi:MAG TPA: hypothetical protein VEL07_02535 [Planctomycetota bacterium]|nr:hypothetical protein [Planctomycetota bacterium]